MEQFKKLWTQYKFLILTILLVLLYFVFTYFGLLKFGWYSFRFNFTWFRFIIFWLFFAFFIAYFAEKEPLLKGYVTLITERLAKLLPKIGKYSFYVVVCVVLLVLTLPMIIRKPMTKKSTISSTTQTTNNYVEPTPMPKVDFAVGQNYGTIWVGSMSTGESGANFFNTTMHVTYTVLFSYNVTDQARKAVKVEVTEIAHTTKLPNKGSVFVLPHSHAKSANITSTNSFEDWNTFGYYNASDYSRMKSLGSTYPPEICANNLSCEYNDQVGKQAGYLGLRFKHLGLATTSEKEYKSDTETISKVFGIGKSQMDATITWKMTVTLDDGSVFSRNYSVNLPGSALDGEYNTSKTISF